MAFKPNLTGIANSPAESHIKWPLEVVTPGVL